MNWMRKAFELPGRDTIKVALLLWQAYSWEWRKKPNEQKKVWITNNVSEWFGIHPRTRTRALDLMADAGLIEWIDRGSGKTPKVKLIFTRVRKGKT